MDINTLYKDLITAQKDGLFRICCSYVSDSDERKDVFQEVLIHIWDGLKSFRGESQLSTWAYRVAVNTCLGWIRSEQRRNQRIVPTSREDLEDTVPANAPADDSVDELEHLYVCIASLRPVDRMLVALYLEDLGTAQIASLMGISESNVRVKIHRIKKELGQLWKDHGYEH